MMNNVNYKYTFIILNYEQSREREKIKTNLYDMVLHFN